MAHPVIAADIGHSAVKAIAWDGKETHRFFVPSVVCQAFAISDEAEAKRALAETVNVAPGPAGRFFIGETALIQGSSNITTLSENWISTREHRALMLGVIKKIQDNVKFDLQPDLVMGLPTNLFKTQADELTAIVQEVFPDFNSVKIIPQAMGPLYELLLEPNGVPSRSHQTNESWGVVEVGFYTSDFMMTKNGRWSQSASDVCNGVRVAVEHLRRVMADKGITMSLHEAENALKSKTVRSFGKSLDISKEVEEAAAVISTEVTDAAKRLMESYVRQLDGVLVAGGGASLVFDALSAEWPHCVLVNDSRFSVAEGMLRLGIARSRKREAENGAAK